MNSSKSHREFVSRRAELLVELFLQDLGATFVSDPRANSGHDFIVAFPNGDGGKNFTAIEVKATDRPVGDTCQLDAKWFKQLAHSNIPSLLLVVDAKQNRLYHAWPGEADLRVTAGVKFIRVPVVPIDEAVKAELRERLSRGVKTASSANKR